MSYHRKADEPGQHRKFPVPASLARHWQNSPLAAATAACAVCLAMLLPAMLHAGWPYTHEGLRPVARMAIIAAHWQLGQLIPVWASNNVMGHGSPSPILYHKAFSYVSALFFAVTGKVKLSLCLGVFTFMVVAFSGMAAACRVLLARRVVAIELFAGTMLVSSNYAATDIWVRGALAEFAALCVMPFVFAWCLAIIRDGSWRPGLGVTFGILVLCHSVIALYTILPLSMALIMAATRWPASLRHWVRPGAASVLVAAMIVLPFGLPMAAFAGYPRTQDFLAYAHHANNIGLARFIWDRSWAWGGSDWTGFSPQLDTGLVAAFAAFCSLAAFGFLRVPRSARSTWWAAGYLVLICTVFMLLQASWALPFYDFYPGGAFLQFSWRLLVFIVPALSLLAVMLLARLAELDRPRLAIGLALLLVAATASNKVWWLSPQRPWFTPAELTQAVHFTHDTDPPEYFPQTPVVGIAPAAQAIRDLPRLDTPSCTVRGGLTDNAEQSTAIFQLNCASPATVSLSPFLAPGLRAKLNGHHVAAWRLCNDPRVHISAPQGGSVVEISLPTWRSTITELMTGRTYRNGDGC